MFHGAPTWPSHLFFIAYVKSQNLIHKYHVDIKNQSFITYLIIFNITYMQKGDNFLIIVLDLGNILSHNEWKAVPRHFDNPGLHAVTLLSKQYYDQSRLQNASF